MSQIQNFTAEAPRRGEWTKCTDQMPPEDTPVMTKIDDANGCRNEQSMLHWSNLWWFPDKSMYVYYVPTHWRPLDPVSEGRAA